MGKRNMRLKHPAVLTVLTLVALGLVACSARVVEQTELSERTEQISPTSNQNKISSQPVEYTIALNRKQLTIDSNALVYRYRPNEYKAAPNYLPLFPILSAIEADYEWNPENNKVNIKDGKNTIELAITLMSGTFITRNGFSWTRYSPKVINGEVWISEYLLVTLLGIDKIQWYERGQEWQLYRFQKQTDRQTPLEKAAADLVKDYLEMKDRALRSPSDRQEWSDLLTPKAQIALSALNPDLYPQNFLKGYIRDISIESGRQLTFEDNLNQGIVKIVARYKTHYDGQPFGGFSDLGYNIPGETIHEQVFLLRADNGKILIDDFMAHRINRTSTGSPIPLLDEVDYIQIGREWQRKIQKPFASYETLSLIASDFITPTLTRINTNNNFHLPGLNDEAVLARFSSEVRQSQGWKDFLSLEGSKDPYYGILDATYYYDGKSLSATLVGNWQDNSATTTPILMEVELVKDKTNTWKFTRLANVRLYKNIRKLELNEPKTYQQLARLYSYLSHVGMSLGFAL